MKKTAEIITEENQYNGYLKVDKATIKHISKDGIISTYSREKLRTSDAVAGLIYNKDIDSVVLVEQHRYPVQTNLRSGFIYEAVAGKIDDKEEPKKAFIRESLEEVGYRIQDKNIIYCNWCYMSPGYSSERIHFFLATVTNKDRVEAGGGIKDDNENIEVHEISYLVFKGMEEYMEDAKLKILFHEAHRKKLFDKK